MTPVLETRGIEKRFGATTALRGVDFTLREGEIHALLGENGAGKSTLSKILAGVVVPDSGDIRLRGTLVEIKSPTHAQALGIGMVFQELDLFSHLTVAENIAVRNAAVGEGVVVRPRALHRWCEPFLKLVGLECEGDRPLRELSVSQKQLVAIARALSLRAKIILMDEPTSSLSQANVESLFGVLESLKASGISVVYVSHKMEEIKRIADRVTVMRDGARIATVDSKEVSMDALIQMMVGRAIRMERRETRAMGSVILDVRSLSTRHISGIRFQLHEGEVLGVAGLVGAGRSELGAALFGLRHHRQIDASLGGRVFAPKRPAQAIREGFCLLPEERRADALLPHMSTIQNSTMLVLKQLRQRGLLSERLESARATPLLGRLKVVADKMHLPVEALSGGNQQKAIMVRCLLANPRVLFLDEPTRGIDVGVKEDLYGLIDELAKQERGILMVSSELPELLRCCDRILVLHEGRQGGIVDVASTSQEQILALATGVPAATGRLS